MATNILAIQSRLSGADIETFTNASWLDSFPFQVAGSAVGYPAAGNTGVGSITVTGVAAQTARGTHAVEIVEAPANDPARFAVRDPNGTLTAIGRVGSPVYAGGIAFSLSVGGTAFAVGDAFVLGVLPTPLDITGIRFDLMLRTDSTTALVSLSASTTTDTIANGGATGQAALRIPTAIMRALPSGAYRYDLVASADGFDVVAYSGTVTHAQGITARAA